MTQKRGRARVLPAVAPRDSTGLVVQWQVAVGASARSHPTDAYAMLRAPSEP